MPGEGLTIDLVQAAAAPSVDEAPIDKGMLLAQLNLFSTDDAYDVVRPGQPYLLTESGEWRGFDLARYGLDSPAYGELSMAISSDGRRIALADPTGLVTVDLLDNTFKRFDLPVHHAIALEWSPDGSTVLLKDRNRRRRPCGPSGCALNVSTKDLSVVPFDLFNSAFGNDGAVIELSTSPSQEADEVITHIEGQKPIETSLRLLASISTAGAPAAARDFAYSQCVAPGGGRDPGVVIVDISSGDATAMLTSSQRRSCRLTAKVWLTDRHLLVAEETAGDLWLWDVQAQRVWQVADGETSGVNLAVAGRVVSTRLARLLRR